MTPQYHPTDEQTARAKAALQELRENQPTSEPPTDDDGKPLTGRELHKAALTRLRMGEDPRAIRSWYETPANGSYLT